MHEGPAIRAGVLALQGAATPHRDALARLGITAREVRAPQDLEGLTHLILPGGESTTIDHLLRLFGLREPLREALAEGRLAALGTCAGAILLGRDDPIRPERPERLGVLDVVLRRNAYGRQIDSFVETLPLEGLGVEPFRATFIRAPRIVSVGPQVEVLGRRGDEPILVRQGKLYAATFHPELAGDDRVHATFLGVESEGIPRRA